MDELKFVGNSLNDLREFPENARREAGYQLSQIQMGFEPQDWKPMTGVSSGVKEIRIHKDGEFRVIYVTKYHDTVFVLHAFQKKTQKTLKKDIELAKVRLRLVKEMAS